MKILRIKDNTQITKDVLEPVQSLVNRIANKTLEQLDSEGVFVFPELLKASDDLTKEQMILQKVNDYYCTGNVMGFLGFGDERISIESRFSVGNEDYFFQYMIERVLDFPNIINLETNASQDDRIYNLLVFLFPHYLKLAMRKGLYKTYTRQQYNDGNVKGTIEISRHITKNTPFIGNVAYSQREYSFDNALIELVRHTIEYIKRKPYGRQLLYNVKDESNLVISATSGYEPYDKGRVIAENKRNPIRHAYYREYRALQHLCLLILQHQKHQIGFGARQIYGILFDGAWLWEEYVNQLIGEHYYHPMNKAGSGAQRLFSGNIGLIYPDFISRQTENRTIADAKYKPIDNIGNRDYLQVLAYMMRFNAKKGFYLYPEFGGIADLDLWLNEGTTYEKNVVPRMDIFVKKHGLKIPNYAKSYDEFCSLINESEQNFVSDIV